MPVNTYTFAGQSTFSPALHGFGSTHHYEKIVSRNDTEAIREARILFLTIQNKHRAYPNHFAALYQRNRQVVEFNDKPEKTIISQYGSRLWKGIDIPWLFV